MRDMKIDLDQKAIRKKIIYTNKIKSEETKSESRPFYFLF